MKAAAGTNALMITSDAISVALHRRGAMPKSELPPTLDSVLSSSWVTSTVTSTVTLPLRVAGASGLSKNRDSWFVILPCLAPLAGGKRHEKWESYPARPIAGSRCPTRSKQTLIPLVHFRTFFLQRVANSRHPRISSRTQRALLLAGGAVLSAPRSTTQFGKLAGYLISEGLLRPVNDVLLL